MINDIFTNKTALQNVLDDDANWGKFTSAILWAVDEKYNLEKPALLIFSDLVIEHLRLLSYKNRDQSNIEIERSLTDWAKAKKVTKQTISRHINKLLDAGLVIRVRESQGTKKAAYSINDAKVAAITKKWIKNNPMWQR